MSMCGHTDGLMWAQTKYSQMIGSICPLDRSCEAYVVVFQEKDWRISSLLYCHYDKILFRIRNYQALQVTINSFGIDFNLLSEKVLNIIDSIRVHRKSKILVNSMSVPHCNQLFVRTRLRRSNTNMFV